MAVVASRRHDEHVHTRSLALAMAAAAQRQRARIRRWHPPSVPASPRQCPVADPPAGAQMPGSWLEALRTTALAQQREATALRRSAREMCASDQEMRLRLAGLAAQIARRDRGSTA